MVEFRLFGGNIHNALVHAATQYDIRQSRGKSYNRYALGQYLMRIDEVEADIKAGTKPRDALVAAFSGRLLDAMLKAIGEDKSTREDQFSGRWTYQPVSKQG